MKLLLSALIVCLCLTVLIRPAMPPPPPPVTLTPTKAAESTPEVIITKEPPMASHFYLPLIVR